ncbi:MAG: HAD family phosphatase, partial [Phycisphaerae bacterium]|nr:HAD family phosphatase [Phycisphaerae bacterium]
MMGVVFDFDGVIVDSEPIHQAALRRAANEVGLDFTHEEYLATYIGFDDRDVLRVLARDRGKALSHDENQRFHQAKRRHFMREVSEGRVRAFPGAVELIRAAAARGPIAVCSGARTHEIDPILEHLGVRSLMATVVSADDVAAQAMPLQWIRAESFDPTRTGDVVPLVLFRAPCEFRQHATKALEQ